VVLIARTPFKCPAAPYEAAFLIHSLLCRRGVRSRVEIALYTPEEYPMPVAGTEVGGALRSLMEAREIEYRPDEYVLKIDVGSRRVLFEVDETDYDLLVGVPPHRAPRVVREAGLLDATGWIPVDPYTLETRHPGVFAIGDVVSIRLRNGMFLPKAGVFAEVQAEVVAERIAAAIEGRETTARFTGEGYCYVEVGDGMAAWGAGEFYADPAPRVRLEPPSVQFQLDKEAFERTRLDTWLS
jgi:sulfide:quinone oxidoreductase